MKSSSSEKLRFLSKVFIFCTYIPYFFILMYSIWEIVMVIAVGRYPIRIQYSAPPTDFVETDYYWIPMFIAFLLAVLGSILWAILWLYLRKNQIEIRKIHTVFLLIAVCLIVYISTFDLWYQWG